MKSGRDNYSTDALSSLLISFQSGKRELSNGRSSLISDLFELLIGVGGCSLFDEISYSRSGMCGLFKKSLVLRINTSGPPSGQDIYLRVESLNKTYVNELRLLIVRGDS